MQYLIDTANVESIKKIINYFPIDGVTTNPSILGAEGIKFSKIIPQILEVLDDQMEIHIQPISKTTNEMVEEAIMYKNKYRLNDKYHAKVPVTLEGLKAIKELNKINIRVTATAIFTAPQALLAARAGADYVAPYVNRLDNLSSHGIDVVGNIVKLFKQYNLKSKVLAASFKNVDQAYRVSLAGSHAMTASPEIFEMMLYHPLTTEAVMDFERKGNEVYDVKTIKMVENMEKETLIVPGDGASNIKLDVYDFDSLEAIFTTVTETPVSDTENFKCNNILEEFNWFDDAIKSIPAEMKNVVAIAPVTRGASSALIGEDNVILDTSDGDKAIAYTHSYPDDVEEKFLEICGSAEKYFSETGSVMSFPGSLCLAKRFLFESMKRPEIYKKAKAFAIFPVVISGHFLNNNFLQAVEKAGNENSYWMCHSGTRNVNEKPGTPSSLTFKLDKFWDLVPHETALPYKSIGNMPKEQSRELELPEKVKVFPGGHDTCFSHIPILSSFYNIQPEYKGTPILQLEAGTWTMSAQLGGLAKLPQNGYKQGIIVQGTVDGEPTVTSMYGGGADFRYVKTLAKNRKLKF